MEPTIRNSDLLNVSHCPFERIRSGDVVVFNSVGQSHLTVHRVLSKNIFGIRTMGDNNDNADPGFLNASCFLGKVLTLQRGSKRKRVHGGSLGSAIGRIMRIRHLLDYKLSRIFRPLYQFLARHRFFIGCPFCRFALKVVSFERNGSENLQLLWGRRLIGWFVPERGAWAIRRPFRLFVDESLLPLGIPPHRSTDHSSNVQSPSRQPDS